MNNNAILYELLPITKNYKNKLLRIDKDGIDFDNVLAKYSILDYEIFINSFTIYTYNNKTIFKIEDLPKIKEFIIDYLDNFYEKYTIDDFDDILEIPVINEEKWVDFIVENIKNLNVSIKDFMFMIYNNNAYKHLKPNFDAKIDYLINASKFDLI